jgi:hypothetical protein
MVVEARQYLGGDKGGMTTLGTQGYRAAISQ